MGPTNEPTSDENPNFRERYACRTTTRYDTPDSLWKGWLAEIEDLTMTSFHQTAGLLCITKHYLSRFPSRCFLSLRLTTKKSSNSFHSRSLFHSPSPFFLLRDFLLASKLSRTGWDENGTTKVLSCEK